MIKGPWDKGSKQSRNSKHPIKIGSWNRIYGHPVLFSNAGPCTDPPPLRASLTLGSPLLEWSSLNATIHKIIEIIDFPSVSSRTPIMVISSFLNHTRFFFPTREAYCFSVCEVPPYVNIWCLGDSLPQYTDMSSERPSHHPFSFWISKTTVPPPVYSQGSRHWT